jgi:hypothetical protein
MQYARLVGSLSTVAAASLLTAADAERIKDASDHLIANTRQVTDSTTANKNDGVFLQVVPFARDVSRYFLTVRKADTSHFT